jgi:hypothetical protein
MHSMNNVVFDEENQVLSKDKEIASARNPYAGALRPTGRRTTVGQNLMMILFAAVCFLAAVGVWIFKPTNKPIPSMYKEEVNEKTVRLIPVGDREEFIQSLPSIN